MMSATSRPVLSPSGAFISGAAYKSHIGHYLDCSADPYDLRPAADLIVRAIKKMRSELNEDIPVALLFGEDHGNALHVALEQLVAARLQAESLNFTVNIEKPANRWGIVARYVMKKNVPDALFYNSQKYDAEGQATLNAYLAYDGITGAPVTHQNFYAFLEDKKIPAAFNDAAKGPNFTLAPQDPYVEIVKGRHDISSDAGRWGARNDVMARRAVDRAAMLGKNVIAQFEGYSHTFGWEQEGCSYEESLCAAYREAGVAVLPVFITLPKVGHGLNILPRAAYEELRNAVVIDGLAENQFNIESNPDKKKIIRIENDLIMALEREFLEKVNAASGGELELYDVDAREEEYQKRASEEADKVIQRYEAA